MSKGSKNEREARDLLAEAGYLTYRPATVRYGENDPFGLFDVLAFHPSKPPLFIQCKTNGATGVRRWMRQTWLWRAHGIKTQYWCRYDREGWRILEPECDGHTTVVDERETGNGIGVDAGMYLDTL